MESATANSNDEDEGSKPVYLVFLFSSFLLTSIPVRIFVRKFNFDVPENFFHFLIAMCIAVLLYSFDYFENSRVVVHFPPTNVISIYVPVYIFTSIYQLDFHILKRYLPQVLVICSLGLLLQLILFTLILVKLLHPGYDFTLAIMISLACLPNHVYNVVMMFKELAKFKHLGAVLETETVVTFIITTSLVKLCLGIEEGIVTEFHQALNIILRLFGLALILGYILGEITVLCMTFLYNDRSSALCICISMVFISYFIAEFIVACSGSLTVARVAQIVFNSRHKFSSALESTMNTFWAILNYIFDILFFMYASVIIVYYAILFCEVEKLYTTIMTLFTISSVRFISIFAIGPLLTKLTHKATIRCLLVLGWCTIKSNPNLLISIILLTSKSSFGAIKDFVVEMVSLVLFSLLLNSSSMRLMLHLIGMAELSLFRKTNMNNCMKFLLDRRFCVINMLKSNRYLADTNWPLLRTTTILAHPYKIDIEQDENYDNELNWDSNSIICPECVKEFRYDISAKEILEMLKDGHMKILKAKKISLIRQFQNGLITKTSLQVLLHHFDTMLESSQTVITVDIASYISNHKYHLALIRILDFIFCEPSITTPTKFFRKICFYIVMHVSYDYIIFFFAILDVAYSFNPHIICHNCKYTNNVIIGIFILDFFMKVCAYSNKNIKNGLKNYFRFIWNVFDFTLITLWLFVITIYSVLPTKKYMHELIDTIDALRLVRVIFLFHPLHPYLVEGIMTKIDQRTCFGYTLATSLVNCCDEVVDLISQIIETTIIKDICVKRLLEEKKQLQAQMERVQRTKPWIAITVKTKLAIGTTLTAIDGSLKQMKISGYVDNIEYNTIAQEILKRYKILRHMKIIQQSPPEVIFSEVPWMVNDEPLKEMLFAFAERVTWEPGNIVFRESKLSKGIYIIVTGLLRIKYEMRPWVIENCKKYGQLPIVDYLSCTNFTNNFEDNLMSGHSIGELCLLTGRPYNCTIFADSPSSAYFLPADSIRSAMKLRNDPVTGLEAKMWKASVINIAVSILFETSIYQSYTHEQIKLKLENAFIPRLHCYKIFVVTEIIEDLILIEGSVVDFNNLDTYTAPVHIPRSVQKLILPRSSYSALEEPIEIKLLIIPLGVGKEYQIMKVEEDVGELVSQPSSRCVLHSFKNKDKRKMTLSRKEDQVVLTKDSAGTTGGINLSKGVFDILNRSNEDKLRIKKQ